MKILHVIANLSPDKGGPPKAAFEMCRALARQGHDISLYTTNAYGRGILDVPIDRPVLVDGVNIHYYPISYLRRWGFSWQLGLSLRNHIVEFDIIHIHSIYIFHTFVAANYSRKYNVPYLIRPHGTLDPFLRRKSRIKKAFYNFLIEKKNLNAAAAIHYTTHEEMALAHHPLNIKAPGFVAPLGVDIGDYTKFLPRGAFRTHFPECRDKRLILFLGRLNFKKGLDILARAYGDVARQQANVHLVIAGPDEEGYGSKVRRWLAEENVLDRVTFTGMLTGNDKLAAFADADVFVLPSYTENFGITVIEALACGLPVVISDKVNISKDIVGAKAGIIVNCLASSVAAGISKILNNPGLAMQLGVNGRKLVEGKFTWDAAVEQLVSVYENIIIQQR